jgi:hypothetical protein
MTDRRVGPFMLDLGDESRELITKWFVEAWYADLIGKTIKSRALISMCIQHIARMIEVDRAFGIPTLRIEEWS